MYDDGKVRRRRAIFICKESKATKTFIVKVAFALYV